MKKVVMLALLLGSTVAWAGGDIAAGKAKSVMCASCHGANGISPNDLWPNLAGQKAAYIAKQIKAFKSGARKDPMMEPMVAALSDQDIENISAFFSSLGK